MPLIKNQLSGKSAAQRAEIKASELSKNNQTWQFVDGDLTVECYGVSAIPGGVQVLARAWENGQQLGFGSDGSIDIERFRIFNPPIMVSDPAGTHSRVVVDEGTGESHELRYREDPLKALQETLAHTINIVKKNGANIVPGKVGNTTSTFYPDADPESTSCDGLIENYQDPGDLPTMSGEANGTSANDSGTNIIAQYSDGGTDGNLQRGITLFDTSAIGSDTVSSAVASLRGLFVANTNSYSVRLVTVAPASNTSLAIGDFDSFGTTSLANEIGVGSFSTSGYNDFTLTDLTQIATGGITKLGWRLTGDISAATATGQNYAQSASADTSGTTSDPKLVVTHAAVAARRLLLLGIGT